MFLPSFQEIHIENTNSCGYKCTMCPRDQQTRKIGFMPLDDFALILERIGTLSGTFHLHGFGEPLLDRKLIEKVRLLKEKKPDSESWIYSTLGVRVKEDYFIKLAEAGMSYIVISCYGFTQDSYKQIHGYDGFDIVKHNLQQLSQAMKLPHASLTAYLKVPGEKKYSSLPIAESSEKTSFCNWAQDLGFNIGKWAHVHNFGNGRHYNAPNPEKMCPVINGMRKKILNVTWDLKVIPCCYDFNATIPFGDLRVNTLEEIFSGPEYFNFLLAHHTNQLENYPVCQNCEKIDCS